MVPILRQMQQDGRWDKLTYCISLDIEEIIRRIEGLKTNYDRYYCIRNAYPFIYFTISNAMGEEPEALSDEYKDHHKDP